MYVRWKRKRLRRRPGMGREPGDSLRAVLVRAERADGRSRQRYIRQLGAIPERNVGMYWVVRDFWTTVDAALDALALDGADRARIVAQVAARVPRIERDDGPSLAELEAKVGRR